MQTLTALIVADYLNKETVMIIKKPKNFAEGLVKGQEGIIINIFCCGYLPYRSSICSRR